MTTAERLHITRGALQRWSVEMMRLHARCQLARMDNSPRVAEYLAAAEEAGRHRAELRHLVKELEAAS